jgi:hypothetical protein
MPLVRIAIRGDFAMRYHVSSREVYGRAVDLTRDHVTVGVSSTVRTKGNITRKRCISDATYDRGTATVHVDEHDRIMLVCSNTCHATGVTQCSPPLECSMADGYSIEDFRAGRAFVAYVLAGDNQTLYNTMDPFTFSTIKHHWESRYAGVAVNVTSTIAQDAHEPYQISRSIHDNEEIWHIRYRAHMNIVINKQMEHAGTMHANTENAAHALLSNSDQELSTLTHDMSL